MIFGMSEFASCHGPKAPGHLNGDTGGLFEAAALHQANGGVDNRFGGQPMDRPGTSAQRRRLEDGMLQSVRPSE